MVDPTATVPVGSPLLSVIIGVYNDWSPLDQCLRSLAQQTKTPSFEVIVVDDGSLQPAPDSIRQWSRCYPLTISRAEHQGVAAARNQGIQVSSGQLLLFVDADCRLHEDCLMKLAVRVTDSPRHHYFQLRLSGDSSTTVGRAEELRLLTLQNHLLQSTGCIRYLNTAGFAIRRSKVDSARGLFDPVARRAEDTLLLADLMQSGELPLFVPEAIVQHAIPLSLVSFLRKAVRSAYLEARTYQVISYKGVRIRVSHGERLRMLVSMWKTSRDPGIGRSAWFVLVIRQALQRVVSLACRCLQIVSKAQPSNQSSLQKQVSAKSERPDPLVKGASASSSDGARRGHTP
jgi:glycosyltransferase involved in cell wall biosynthesis